MPINVLSKSLITALLLVVGAVAQAEPGVEEEGISAHGVYLGSIGRVVNNRVTAVMNIEGRTFPLALDTGAGTKTVLFKPAVDQLGLDIRENKELSNWYYVSARVGIGDRGAVLSDPMEISVIDVPVAVLKKHYGIIGWQVMKEMVVELDIPQARWHKHDAVPAEVIDGWQSFPIRETDGQNLQIAIQDKDKGQELLVSLDTGATGGISLDKAEWERWRQQAEPDWVTIEAGYSPATRGGFSITKTAIVDSFHLGEFDLGRVRVEETFIEVRLNGEPVGYKPITLGLDVLRQRRIVIDGPGERVYFGPLSDDASEGLAKINRAQATFAPQSVKSDDQTAHVINDGIAYKAGLRSGDKILMVDGNLASNWRNDDAVRPATVFNKKPGTRVRLLVERDGERFPITIELGRSPLDPVENSGS